MNQINKRVNFTSSSSTAQIVPLDIIQIIQQRGLYRERIKNEKIKIIESKDQIDLNIDQLQDSTKQIDVSQSKQQSKDQMLGVPDIYQRSSFKSVGTICRICEMPEMRGNPLIRVCRCFRSKKYVHEYCLKKQIVEKLKINLERATCEICSQKYNMDLKIQRIYSPSQAWHQSKDKLPLICLIVFLIVMIVLLILLSIRMNVANDNTKDQNFLENEMFLLIFIIFSCIVILVLLWLIGMIIKGLLFVEKIVLWKINEYIPVKKSILNTNIQLSNITQNSFKKKTITKNNIPTTEPSTNRLMGHQLTVKIDSQAICNSQQRVLEEKQIPSTGISSNKSTSRKARFSLI